MRVSVIIATYGDDSWAEMARARAYPSALLQDPHEIIIDHNEDATIATVRNDLANEATGEWLCFLDADDELGPHYLEAMGRAYEREHKTDLGSFLFTPAISYVRKGKPQSPMFHPVANLMQNNYIVIGTLLERELFKKAKGFGDYPHGFEDWSLWAKCSKLGARIVKVRDAIYYAHHNPHSKHREAWRNREWQVQTHLQVQQDLIAWTP